MVRIGIVGAGIGGLAATIALQADGHDVQVLEQAPVFGHVGADINLTPNATRALDGLGVGAAVREKASRPKYRISRDWDSGKETSRLPMSDEAERKYGAPQLTLHRADLLDALLDAVKPETVRFDHRVAGCTFEDEGVTVQFDKQPDAKFDLLIGADGIHSAVRRAMFGAEKPTFSGVVAFRSVVPIENATGLTNTDSFTKWWGPTPEVQIVTFPLSRGEEMFIFATAPQESWTDESWTQPGDVQEMNSLYRDFHPEARAYLELCSDALKSALYVRNPLEKWGSDRATLLGDACHPMTPFMAQGAGQAIEDGVVLARSLRLIPELGVAGALEAYEQARRPRTSKIQIASRENNWLKVAGDADWLYEYDAWNAELSTA